MLCATGLDEPTSTRDVRVEPTRKATSGPIATDDAACSGTTRTRSPVDGPTPPSPPDAPGASSTQIGFSSFLEVQPGALAVARRRPLLLTRRQTNPGSLISRPETVHPEVPVSIGT